MWCLPGRYRALLSSWRAHSDFQANRLFLVFFRLPPMTYLQLSFADATEYAGEFDQGMNQGHGVLTFNDKVRPRTNMESG